MKKELKLTDVTEKLCQHCAHCCLNILIPTSVNDRTLEHFSDTGIDIEITDETTGEALVNMGPCKNLVIDGDKYRCGIHDSKSQLCKDFNCVAWGLFAGVKETFFTARALEVYNQLQSNKKT